MAPLGAGYNAHYEGPPGEQPVAQLFRCIPENSWLFRYGRIPMSFFTRRLGLAGGFLFFGPFFWVLDAGSLFPENLFTTQGRRAM